MNIFVLARDPVVAARQQCDKHVPKMLLEATQILCNTYPDGSVPYKRTHYNHPCSKWTRESLVNFFWLMQHAWALSYEYRYRFGRMHASEAVLFWLEHKDPLPFRVFETAQEEHAKNLHFVQAMPERYRGSNVVAAYRRYYAAEKSRFAKWERGRNEPRWWRRYLREAKEGT